MTLVSLQSPIYWPGIGNVNNTPAYSNPTSLTAAGHYHAYIFVAREDMVISHVLYRVGASTGSPTVTVSIETIDATGLPAGADGFGSTNSGASGALTANTVTLAALGGSATITKGTPFAVKIAYTSGTTVSMSAVANVNSQYSSALPYMVINTASAVKTAMSTTNGAGIVAVGSSATTFYQLPGAMVPYSNVAGGGAFNNTNSAKRGLVFTIPMNCRCIGIRFFNGTSTGNYNAVIFDNGGTPAELSSSSTAFDGDLNAVNASMLNVYFDNTVTLTAGTTYRAVIEPTSATNVTMLTYTLSSTNYRGATPLGTAGNYTTFATATWTDSATTDVPLLDIIIDQIDNGSGTGGVVGVIGG